MTKVLIGLVLKYYREVLGTLWFIFLVEDMLSKIRKKHLDFDCLNKEILGIYPATFIVKLSVC